MVTLPPHPLVVVLLGSTGSDVTAIGQALAQHWGWPYHDGNAFDPLDVLHWKAEDTLAAGDSAIIGCGALDEASRELVRGYLTRIVFVQLAGDKTTEEPADGVVRADTGVLEDERIQRIAEAVTAWQANDIPPPPV